MNKQWIMGWVTVFCVSALTMAGLIEVGSGDNTANIYIEWSDGFSAEFVVRFEDASKSGLEVIRVIDSTLGDAFTAAEVQASFGVFIDGFTYTDELNVVHSNIGFGGGENWWHYWTKNAGQTDWASPWFGAADRTMVSGDSDGWIYGRVGTPVPEPITALLLALGAGIAGVKRK